MTGRCGIRHFHLAIFDSPDGLGDPEHVCILVECKAWSERAGINQLKAYLSLEPKARLGIWFNGQAHALVYKQAGAVVASIAILRFPALMILLLQPRARSPLPTATSSRRRTWERYSGACAIGLPLRTAM